MTSNQAPTRPPDDTAQRALGAYYTPRGLAEVLVNWAVLNPDTRLLDPSSGGGVFLDAATRRLKHLGASQPGERICGIELDFTAARLLRVRAGDTIPAKNIVDGDFFAQSAASLGSFDAIVGNPPYIRHHQLDGAIRARARARAAEAGLVINNQADLWAYFVVHALTMLAPRGRLALILPGSILHADYAAPVLRALSAMPGRAELTRVQSLQFDSVQERTVVLTVDARANRSDLAYREVANLESLHKALSTTLHGHRASAVPFRTSREERLRPLLSAPTRRLWDEVHDLPQVVRLQDVATVRIGVVTGANAFFARTSAEITDLLPGTEAESTVSVVTRSRWLRGLRWTDEDVASVGAEPSRLLALPSSHVPGKVLAASIALAATSGIPDRAHCAKRDPWWALSDVGAPDLFLPYMGGTPPRLVANEAGSTCTNAIHRVDLMATSVDARVVALSSWTSLYRLGAELAGRQYAGGVLKFELAEARQLLLPIPPLDEVVLERAEALVARNEPARVASLADQVLLKDCLGLDESDVRALDRGAKLLAKRRRGS